MSSENKYNIKLKINVILPIVRNSEKSNKDNSTRIVKYPNFCDSKISLSEFTCFYDLTYYRMYAQHKELVYYVLKITK